MFLPFLLTLVDSSVEDTLAFLHAILFLHGPHDFGTVAAEILGDWQACLFYIIRQMNLASGTPTRLLHEGHPTRSPSYRLDAPCHPFLGVTLVCHQYHTAAR